jgi:hypothetical protein
MSRRVEAGTQSRVKKGEEEEKEEVMMMNEVMRLR